MRARSTAASVCPARTITPPVRDRSGNMWPGRARSDGRVAGSMAARTVSARSLAEIPVLVVPFASIDTQNAVSNRELFCDTISGISSSSRRSGVIDRQIEPAAVARHEVDRFRRDLLGGNRQVAFVLAIRVVHDDDDAARPGWRRAHLRWARTARCLRRAPLAILIGTFQCVTSPALTPARLSPASSTARATYFPTMIAFEVDAVANPGASEVGVLHGVRNHLDLEADRCRGRRWSG